MDAQVDDRFVESLAEEHLFGHNASVRPQRTEELQLLREQ
jgi:hypothetical protein